MTTNAPTPPLTARQLGLCGREGDPVAYAAADAYKAASTATRADAIGIAVSAGVEEALRQAGVVRSEAEGTS